MIPLVSIYKSPNKDEMYLYVPKGSDPTDQFSQVPDALAKAFGEPVHVFDLLLTPNKKLARADTAKVLQSLEEQGYFLQMPPASERDDYALNLPDELLCMNDPV